MAGSKIVITGEEVLTLDKHVKWEFDMRVVDANNGRVEYQDIYINVEGDVREASKEATWDRLIELQEQITSEFNPRKVELYHDGAGSPKYTYLPAECIGSPRVINFRTIPDDGNNEMHWRYAFTIYIQKPGSTNVIELQTSIFEETEKGVVVRKVWRAACKGLTLSIAKSVVMGFKPSKFTTQKLEQFPQDQRYIAEWSWDREEEKKTQQSGTPEIDEEPIIAAFGARRFIETPRMDNADPILQQRRRRATRILVKGRVNGVADANGNPPNLSPPPAHYSASTTMYRAEGEEEYGYVTYDQVNDIYFLPYMEVWYCTSQAVPSPDHHGHLKRPALLTPGNGPIGS